MDVESEKRFREIETSLNKLLTLSEKTKRGFKAFCSIKKFILKHKTNIAIIANILQLIAYILLLF